MNVIHDTGLYDDRVCKRACWHVGTRENAADHLAIQE